MPSGKETRPCLEWRLNVSDYKVFSPLCWQLQSLGRHWYALHSPSLGIWSSPRCLWCLRSALLSPCSTEGPSECPRSHLQWQMDTVNRLKARVTRMPNKMASNLHVHFLPFCFAPPTKHNWMPSFWAKKQQRDGLTVRSLRGTSATTLRHNLIRAFYSSSWKSLR